MLTNKFDWIVFFNFLHTVSFFVALVVLTRQRTRRRDIYYYRKSENLYCLYIKSEIYILIFNRCYRTFFMLEKLKQNFFSNPKDVFNTLIFNLKIFGYMVNLGISGRVLYANLRFESS